MFSSLNKPRAKEAVVEAEQKRRLSDALAWFAFYVLMLWMLCVLLGASGYVAIFEQIASAIGLIKDCEGESCSVYVNLDDTPIDPIILGMNVSWVRDLRFPLFMTWLGIMVVQAILVKRTRLWPWTRITEYDLRPRGQQGNNETDDVKRQG